MATYYEEHSKQLLAAIKNIESQRAQSDLNFFFHKDLGLFEQLESAVTKNQMRYYQMEALYVLDYIIDLPETKKEKKTLLEIIDKDTKEKAPFVGFEMATGSGKTMLMGASIYYLYKKH